MKLNNFIFDLGGVIIDLDESATLKSFAKIADKTEDEIKEFYQSTDAFIKYEKGLISDSQFRISLKKFLGIHLTDLEIDEAWNAMLGKIPLERLKLLQSLRSNNKVFILSNTNAIHIKAFNKILNEVSGKKNLNDFADKVFFSHDLQMRKPDIEIYQEVLKLTESKFSESIFMDDKIENLLGAKSVGIHTKHITKPNQIFELEKYVG